MEDLIGCSAHEAANRGFGRRAHYVADGSWWEQGQENCLGGSTHEAVDRGFGRRAHDVADGSWWELGEENCLGGSTHEGANRGFGRRAHDVADGSWWELGEENCLGGSTHEGANRGFGRRAHDVADGSWWELGQENCLGGSTHEAARIPWGIRCQQFLGRSVLGRSRPEAEQKDRAKDRKAGSFWEEFLHEAMRSRGWNPIQQYSIMDRRLDFALFGEYVKLDIEVDGRHWHQDADGNRKIDDYVRDAQLRNAGWKVVRFWVDELASDIEVCLDRIEQELR